MKEYLKEQGVIVDIPKIKLEELKKKYVGKVIDKEKLQNAGDVWNLDIKANHLEGHFYWNGEKHRYLDVFSIKVDDTMTILDIDPLDTNTADSGIINSCRYTLNHNGQFDLLLSASTS